MPEYLSPGVYVEEFEIGAKPIEGVSTSTAGFVGMAEMGPIDKPTLVTNFGEYQRIFGGYLGEKDEKNENYKFEDPDKKPINMRFLPYSVEGFFSNGGQRLYVTRVANKKDAATSKGFLPDVSGITTTLVSDVQANARTILVNATPRLQNLSAKDSLLLQDEMRSEYPTFDRFVKALTLSDKLKNPYDTTTGLITKMVDDPNTSAFKITKIDTTDTKKIFFETASDAEFQLLKKDNVLINQSKHIIYIIQSVGTIADKSITVDSSIGIAPNEDLSKFVPSGDVSDQTNIILSVKKDENVVLIADTITAFDLNTPVMIGAGTASEFCHINKIDPSGNNIKNILINEELKYQHKIIDNKSIEIIQLVKVIDVEAANPGTWGDRIKIVVRKSPNPEIKLKKKASNQNFLELETVTGLKKYTLLQIHTSPAIYRTITEVQKTEDTAIVELESNIAEDLSVDTKVSAVEFDLTVIYEDKVEVFKNLSMNKKHDQYIEKEITEKTSQLIRITKVDDVTSTPDPSKKMPRPTMDKMPGWKLSGGKNGIPLDKGDVISVYKGEPNDEPLKRTGLETLKNIDDISIVAMPGITIQDLQNQLIIHCETMKNRFAVLDSEAGADLDGIQKQKNYYDSKFAALYYPWIRAFDTHPDFKKPVNVPPSGYVCGIYARSDTERGVHKAPANEVVSGALDLEEISPSNEIKRIITKGQQDILNPKGINCIRVFPGRGIRVWGARTISSDSLWKYINIRRLFIYVEGSIYKGTQWVVFEPNNEKLWGRVKATIDEFLTRVWRDGALMGLKAEEAFFIKCDRTTMTQADIDNGRLICIIGIAPVKPAEFVIFRIAQWAGGSAAKE